MATMADVGERAFLASLPSIFSVHPNALCGFDEDAVPLMNSDQCPLVFNLDRGVRPPGEHLGIFDIPSYARWAITAAVSDLLVKGAKPTAIMNEVFLPPDLSVDDGRALFEELETWARSYGAFVLGGDTKCGDGVKIVIMAVGSLSSTSHFVRRSGARVGDVVAVTGCLGDIWSLFVSRHNGIQADLSASVLQKLLAPRAPLQTLLTVTGHRAANSSMDISDGLGGALWEVATLSGVRLHVFADRLPVSAETAAVGAKLGITPYKLAFDIGGEWQSLLTCEPDRFDAIQQVLARDGNILVPIGRVESGSGVTIDTGSATKDLPRFQDDAFHFRDFTDAIRRWETLVLPL